MNQAVLDSRNLVYFSMRQTDTWEVALARPLNYFFPIAGLGYRGYGACHNWYHSAFAEERFLSTQQSIKSLNCIYMILHLYKLKTLVLKNKIMQTKLNNLSRNYFFDLLSQNNIWL